MEREGAGEAATKTHRLQMQDYNCIAVKRVSPVSPPVSLALFFLTPPPPTTTTHTHISLILPFSLAPPHPLRLVCAICPLSRRNVSAGAAECGEQIGGRAWTMEHASLLGHSSSLLGPVGMGGRGEGEGGGGVRKESHFVKGELLGHMDIQMQTVGVRRKVVVDSHQQITERHICLNGI